MAPKNKNVNSVEWYDLLLKACEKGDEPLLDPPAFLSRIKPNPSRPPLTNNERESLFQCILPRFNIPKEARTCVDSVEFFDHCEALWQKSQIEKSLPQKNVQSPTKGRKI